MNNTTDFSKITPCGGNCSECNHFNNNECEGCVKSGGKCVHMWENGCKIFECCQSHNVKFCGLCEIFPCEYIISKLGEWDKDGIAKQSRLANEFKQIMIGE